NDRNRFWGYTDNSLASSASIPAAVPTGAPTATLAPTATSEFVVTTNAAYQVFENGFMIWRADTGAILTFPKQTGVQQFLQGDYENLPDNPVTDAPPEARLSPINGFGRVWGNFSQVRGALGWAMDGEKSYQTTLHTTYVMSPDGVKSIPGLCLNLPDGRSAQYPQFSGATAVWGYVESCG
ncbi:MAG: hypothetical protein K8I30_14975, partial [Anaerolineae bacterium]|nr:hypothetical protein [Anaerolineae bacterium]